MNSLPKETHERIKLPNVGFNEDTPFEKDVDILLTKISSMDTWHQVYNLRRCLEHNKSAFWANDEVHLHIERLVKELLPD